MEDETKDIKDFLDVLRRRRVPMIIIIIMLFVIGLGFALVWPPTYRSTATILIEAQEIPRDLVRSTITSYASQRIQTISQRVMTRSNLMEIIEKYDLYKKERKRQPTEKILSRMREDLQVKPIRAEVVDPRSGRPVEATIAFTLSFQSEAPRLAQKVANELTTLYLNENLRTRTEKAEETFIFLTTEADKLGQRITDLEKKLAEFKQENVNTLPELKPLNMSLLERTEKELTDLDNHLRSLEDRKFYLDGQLAQINPQMPTISVRGEPVLDLETRLKTLRNQYISATARYAPDHPDILKLRREIEGLEKHVEGVDNSEELKKNLAGLRSRLKSVQERYSDDHPDVISLKREIAILEDELKDPRYSGLSADDMAPKPDNPAYLTLRANLEAVMSEIQSIAKKRKQLEAKLDEYEQRIFKSPQVEKDYMALAREHRNATARYHEIRGKQMEAEVGQELEKERKGERFSLIDPPQLPEEPISPNRPAIILIGFVLSLAGGIGYSAIAEAMDSSIRGVKGVYSILNVQPLSVIPYKENNEDILRREKTNRIVLVSTLASIVLLVLLVHFLWSPLDVLWFRGLRKVDAVIGS